MSEVPIEGGKKPKDSYETIYNFTITPIPNEDDPLNIDFDIFYFDVHSTKLNVIRIVNAYMSFMICKLPGLTTKQTLNWVKIKAKKYPEGKFQFKIRNDIRDSAFCVFDHLLEYIEIFSRSPEVLNKLKEDLENELRNDYYKNLRKKDLPPWDRVFLEETESPFRFTQYSTNVLNSKYWLSGKFNIPITGYIDVNMKKLKEYQGHHLRPLSNRIEKMYICVANGLDHFINDGIWQTFRTVKIDDKYHNKQMDNIIVASYDIETYVRDANPNPEADDQPVFCVGVSFFKISDETPFKRYCILADDLMKDEEIRASLIPTKTGIIPDSWLDSNPILDIVKPSKDKSNDNGSNEKQTKSEHESHEEIKETNINSNDKESNEIPPISKDDNKPIEDLDPDKLKGSGISQEQENGFKYIPIEHYVREYIVKNEYKDEAINDKEGQLIYKHPELDETTYICLKREDKQVELRIMLAFIGILARHHPHIILGFNNYMFDDVAMYHRMERNTQIKNKFLQLFTPYNLNEIESGDDALARNSKKHLKPVFRSFPLKMEGKVANRDNRTVRATLVQSMDAYKILLKADAKRFSQDGRLDTMLAFYNINDQSLSKFKLDKIEITDEHGEKHIETNNYQIMFYCWVHAQQLYQIAKYCCQDAWITGTLLIARAGILDKLAMAGTTFTSFEDSIFLADGHRVSCLNSHKGYMAGFSVMDSADKQREDKRNDPSIRALGEKYFCRCKLVGGAVRNVHAYRALAIVAGDYSAQYPNNWIANNIDSSARVPRYIIDHPKDFGLEIVHTVEINDTYGPRTVLYLKNIGNDNTFDMSMRRKAIVYSKKGETQ